MEHPAIASIRGAIVGTSFEYDLYQVGGAVRDEWLGLPHAGDIDLVTRGSAIQLAELLAAKGLSDISPVTYPRFGTAMVRVAGTAIELVTARRESYEATSRKPTVEPASYEEDASRRDFTINTLMRNVTTGELRDPLDSAIQDLRDQVLRTPVDPGETFRDDPLRMLRAIRFRWKLGLAPASGLYEAIAEHCERLRIISFERIRDELVKIFVAPTASEALADILDLGLFEWIAPEFLALKGCEQGRYHFLDAWDHTRLVVHNAGPGNLKLALAALFHDIGKPSTRTIDAKGDTRFFGHDGVGAEMTLTILRRWKFAERDIAPVASLVKNHMRLGTAREFTPSAARRLIRDLGDELETLLQLVEADASALAPGVRRLDLSLVRERLRAAGEVTPRSSLESPLSGVQIMEILQIKPGPEVGRWKQRLIDAVIEGEIPPCDPDTARAFLAARS